MDSIIIYPKNEKQKFLLKSLLEEMKIRFVVEKSEDETLLSESDYIAKIEKSIMQSGLGQRKTLSKDQQKSFLGL
jgi:SOS response regulatory protein OraA/RecX